jgi:hypothetical protein
VQIYILSRLQHERWINEGSGDRWIA